eukprot:scaffold29486_cov110-Isochrysis_galbana.AAC.3
MQGLGKSARPSGMTPAELQERVDKEPYAVVMQAVHDNVFEPWPPTRVRRCVRQMLRPPDRGGGVRRRQGHRRRAARARQRAARVLAAAPGDLRQGVGAGGGQQRAAHGGHQAHAQGPSRGDGRPRDRLGGPRGRVRRDAARGGGDGRHHSGSLLGVSSSRHPPAR